jgi:PAS domain S-box-containing protein
LHRENTACIHERKTPEPAGAATWERFELERLLRSTNERFSFSSDTEWVWSMKQNNFSAHSESKIGEESYQLLVKEVREYAIVMLDNDGVVRTWNVGAERLTGYKAEEIIGRRFSCFYREEDIQADKPRRVLELAVEDGRFEDEDWRVRKDGSEFWANVVITTLLDEGGRHCGFQSYVSKPAALDDLLGVVSKLAHHA